jgi:pimeloyl-ACP methyl ester carboxylesterase
MKYLIIFLIFITTVHAGFGDYKPRDDWKVHKHCTLNHKQKNYCLEIVEIENKKPDAKKILLMPGLFQNAYIFDLIPEDGISVARYMIDKYNLHPFILHTRGVGNSTYIENSSMDEIAGEDIANAVNYLYELNNRKKILIGGHSQGAITTQAYLSGLSFCLGLPCFNPVTAFLRQKKVAKAILLAGNSAMSFEDFSILTPISKAALKSELILRPIDEIDMNTFTKITGLVTRTPFWEMLYNRENVSQKSRDALYKYSVDTSTRGILLQFAQGVLDQDIKTRKTQMSFRDHHKNIRIPIMQQTYGDDKLADPISTKSDSFRYIGSKEKFYETIWDRGHEDFFMQKELHQDLDSVLEFVTQ